MSKNTILLGITEFNRIVDCLKEFPDAKTLEITVDSISGIGKVTELLIPTKVNGVQGRLNITITDENDW